MELRIDKRENLYFTWKVVFSVLELLVVVAIFSALGSAGIGTMGATLAVVVLYAAMIALFFLLQKVYLIGYLKGDGVTVSERQFPEVFALYKAMGEELGLKKLPSLFLIQQGGALNAFAVRFSGHNYIAIYSDVFSLISSDMETVKFILGHELGHVKRGHMSKRFWTCLSSIIPFLTPAYSRSCEYTCDNIGHHFAKENPLNGLVLLAAGKDLYQRVDVASYVADAQANNTDAVKFTGLFIGHPFLPNRIRNLQDGKRP